MVIHLLALLSDSGTGPNWPAACAIGAGIAYLVLAGPRR